jgi:hypothetical protein
VKGEDRVHTKDLSHLDTRSSPGSFRREVRIYRSVCARQGDPCECSPSAACTNAPMRRAFNIDLQCLTSVLDSCRGFDDCAFGIGRLSRRRTPPRAKESAIRIRDVDRTADVNQFHSRHQSWRSPGPSRPRHTNQPAFIDHMVTTGHAWDETICAHNECKTANGWKLDSGK